MKLIGSVSDFDRKSAQEKINLYQQNLVVKQEYDDLLNLRSFKIRFIRDYKIQEWVVGEVTV